jgi:hypothetical protein
MDTAHPDKIAEATQDKKAKLESRGYSTSHLSSLEIDELFKWIEQERSANDWRSKL